MTSHYEGKIEPIEYMQAIMTPAEFRGFLKGNVLKYISRAERKGNPADDYHKAYVYARWLSEYTVYGKIIFSGDRFEYTEEELENTHTMSLAQKMQYDGGLE